MSIPTDNNFPRAPIAEHGVNQEQRITNVGAPIHYQIMINDLPIEILGTIFKYCPEGDHVRSIRSVCKHWKVITDDLIFEGIWRRVMQKFPDLTGDMQVEEDANHLNFLRLTLLSQKFESPFLLTSSREYEQQLFSNQS